MFTNNPPNLHNLLLRLGFQTFQPLILLIQFLDLILILRHPATNIRLHGFQFFEDRYEYLISLLDAALKRFV